MTKLKKTLITTDKNLEMLIRETIEIKLNRQVKERQATGDHRVCAAHDLAPLLERVFDFRPKNLAKDSGFQKIRRKYGLALPAEQEFVGLCAQKRRS